MLNVSIKNIKLNHSKTLLRDINFELGKNKIFTILGKNGSGKSTLIKSLTKLLDHRFYTTEGSVLYEGKDILTLNMDDLLDLRRNKIKYVFQDSVNSFDHQKAFKYYFKRIAKDISGIDDLLKYFLLPDYKYLSTLFPYEVSGGMAQRINFVLALISQPEIIILDEPTSGIDPAIANLFLLKLKDFVQINSNSVLLVTHDLVFAQNISDKIAYLSDGTLSKFYSPDEFFKLTNDEQLNEFLNALQQIKS